MAIKPALLAILALSSASVHANDSAAMKQCMDIMRKSSESVSDTDLKTTCKQQLKAHKQHPSDRQPATAPLPSPVPPT